MIYFYSDTHFSHRKMEQTRPQFKDVYHMNESLIESFNHIVRENDTTYFLGDFAWGDNPEKYLDRLNGHFYFIKGNHDHGEIKHSKILHWYPGYYDAKFGEQPITLCHFPMHSWNKSHYGAWHLYGHHHSKTEFGGKTMNVTVDALGFKPISWDEVVYQMDRKPDNWDLIRR